VPIPAAGKMAVILLIGIEERVAQTAPRPLPQEIEFTSSAPVLGNARRAADQVLRAWSQAQRGKSLRRGI